MSNLPCPKALAGAPDHFHRYFARLKCPVKRERMILAQWMVEIRTNAIKRR
ncbi:MAG TPA: hypothetical protein VIT91_19050 [Chthoniobacterales bacterium]